MQTISLISTTPWRAAHPRLKFPDSPFSSSTTTHRPILHPINSYPSYSNSNSFIVNNNTNAASSSSSSSSSSTESLRLLSPDTLSRVASAGDADEALQLIISDFDCKPGSLTTTDCSSIISAAFARNNPDLALSIFRSMRASVPQEISESVCTWMWPRPDPSTYSLLVKGLAMCLRVSDALKVVSSACQLGVSHGEEVPFGVIVKCPCCMIAVSVAQPQHGSQIVSCFKCRYQYELVSGSIVSIESEAVSMDIPAWEKGLRFLRIKKENIPAAVHSVIVQTPSGMACTHRFGTKSVDLPAQEGERVTIALASNVYKGVGPLNFNTKAPEFYPGEPLCLTNHRNGRESPLLRAPLKDGSASLLSPSFLFPLLAMTATGDAASGIIDPRLPQLISVAVIGSLAIGSAIRFLVVPQLSRLSGRTVEAVAIKQQLLSQYDLLQTRIRELREAVEKEIWMLARMSQLESKILAVGEPSYRSRRSRIKKVRDSLENSIQGRVELIDSFAKISSMIEIEIEMDTDVLAAEAASNAERIAEQIQQIMELESLEEKWRIQAEANDEVEGLLRSETTLGEQL